MLRCCCPPTPPSSLPRTLGVAAARHHWRPSPPLPLPGTAAATPAPPSPRLHRATAALLAWRCLAATASPPPRCFRLVSTSTLGAASHVAARPRCAAVTPLLSATALGAACCHHPPPHRRRSSCPSPHRLPLTRRPTSPCCVCRYALATPLALLSPRCSLPPQYVSRLLPATSSHRLAHRLATRPTLSTAPLHPPGTVSPGSQWPHVIAQPPHLIAAHAELISTADRHRALRPPTHARHAAARLGHRRHASPPTPLFAPTVAVHVAAPPAHHVPTTHGRLPLRPRRVPTCSTRRHRRTCCYCAATGRTCVREALFCPR